jgi:hypothetical protein
MRTILLTPCAKGSRRLPCPSPAGASNE